MNYSSHKKYIAKYDQERKEKLINRYDAIIIRKNYFKEIICSHCLKHDELLHYSTLTNQIMNFKLSFHMRAKFVAFVMHTLHVKGIVPTETDRRWIGWSNSNRRREA